MKAFFSKLVRILGEETQGLHFERTALGIASRLPFGMNGEVRALRAAGFSIEEDVVLEGGLRLTGKRPLRGRLVIGKGAELGFGIVLDLEEKITIGSGAVLGPFTTILTSTHELGPKEHRAGTVTRAPVKIGAGALLGARVLVLPGVTIGEGAEVRPGSVVNRDVAPGTRVEGVPIALVKEPPP